MKLRRNARMVLSFYGISIPIFSLFVSHIVKCGAFFIIVVFEKQIFGQEKKRFKRALKSLRETATIPWKEKNSR